MSLHLVGVNHKAAPVVIREKLAIPERRLPELLQRLLQYPEVGEAWILCACDRLELMAVSQNGNSQLRAFLQDYGKLSARELDPYVYEYSERDAIRHLFRVAASLDTRSLRQTELLSRIRRACRVARSGQTLGPQLNPLLDHAFAVAKQVRAATALDSSPLSIASAIEELAERVFGSLQGQNVLLVGSGKVGELAAHHLLAHGAASLSVVHPSYAQAVELASRLGGSALAIEELHQRCHRADLIVVSTALPAANFDREHAEIFLGRRKNRPMIFLDLAAPRGIEAAMNKVEGIFVYNIEDLQGIASAAAVRRRRYTSQLETIIDREVERFHARLQILDVVSTIVSLREHLEEIRRRETTRLSGPLASLTAGQRLVVDELTSSLVNKIAHAPIAALKASAQGLEGGIAAAAVSRTFGLPEVKEARSNTENQHAAAA